MDSFTTASYTTKITDLIKQYEKTNDKSLSDWYRPELFDFVEEFLENWHPCCKELSVIYPNLPSDIKLLPVVNLENLLKYINITLFNEIKKKLQNNEENSKTTNIKLNDLDETPSNSWKLKVEEYVTEVKSSLKKILESNIENERNFKVTMILSSDFSNLLENKSNNKFDCFTEFDNLLKKYNIQRFTHNFLNKSNKLTFLVAKQQNYLNEKINLNLEKNIILLLITKKQDDFRLQIYNKVHFWPYIEPLKFVKSIVTKIIFDKKITNLSKAKIFAIKS